MTSPLRAFHIIDPLSAEMTHRLVRDIGEVELQSRHGVPYTTTGVELYKYFFEIVEDMQEEPGEARTAALYLTLKLIRNQTRRPDNDPVQTSAPDRSSDPGSIPNPAG